MPRRPRIFVENSFYHLILRGNSREALFRCDADIESFHELAIRGLARYGCQLHAYCWMTNHIHAIVQVSDRPLWHYVRWLGTEYARRFNRRYQRSGHAFERRHRAILVDDDDYLLTLVRYIHLNPVDAGMVTDPENHCWNSHRAYLDPGERPPWLQTQFVLALFSADMTKAIQRYASFVTDAAGCEQRHTIDASIWSSNSGSPVTKSGLDCRTSTARLNDYFLRQQGLSTELLTTLKGPDRARRLVRLRAQLAAQVLDSHVATLTEIAAYFGRSRAALSRTLSRYRRDLANN